MKGCTFHRPIKIMYLLNLLATLRNCADQCPRIHPADTNDLSNLGATSQNVMRTGRKTDRPDLREGVAFKSVLQQSGHLAVHSNDLQSVEIRKGFDGSRTRGKSCFCRIASKTDGYAPASNHQNFNPPTRFEFEHTGHAKQSLDFRKPKRSSESTNPYYLQNSYLNQRPSESLNKVQAAPKAEGKIDFATICTFEKAHATHRFSPDIDG
jgi:hypothetical protein